VDRLVLKAMADEPPNGANHQAAQPQPLPQSLQPRLWQRDLQHELEQQLLSQPQPL